MNIAHDERYGLFAAALALTEKMSLEAEDAELAPACREVRFGHLLDLRFGHCIHNYICRIGLRGAGSVERRKWTRC